MVQNENLGGILSDVSPEKCFWINNGDVIRNLYEFASAISNMSEETFSHHVNSEKNDFGKWIREVLHDDKLASDLEKTNNKKLTLKIIKKRINDIEKKTYKKKISSIGETGVENRIKYGYTLNQLAMVFVIGLVLGIITGIFLISYINT